MGTAVGIPVIGLYAATNPARSGPYLSRQWCVDKYDVAARRLLGKPAADMPWTTKIERPGVMDLITPDDVIKKLHCAAAGLARKRASLPLDARCETAAHVRALPVTLPITLLVIARNEAPIIGRCLDSVPFAAEKLVIDSGSTDGTQRVAARHGARVVHQDWLGFGPQRNFASTQASHDWILALDADEALSAELADELQQRLPQLMQSQSAGRDPAPPDLVHGRTDALVSADGGRADGPPLPSRPRALDGRARA